MDDIPIGPVQRCFLMPEIVNLMCGAVDALPTPFCWWALSSLARTSSFFHEPALDYLWSSISGIDRLLKCMPADLWREELTPEHQRTFHFNRPMVQSDLSRLHSYTRRIKHFQCSDMAHYNKSSVVGMCQALLLTNTSTLLPKLHTLSWKYTDEHIFPHVCIFLGPNLVELTLALDGNSPVQLSLLTTLRMQHPHIERFSIICVGQRAPSVTGAVSDTVCGWHRLRAITVPDLTPAALVHLANLPDLKAVKITSASSEGDYSSTLSTTTNSLGFPALETFDIFFCDDLKVATAAVEAMLSCHLKRLYVSDVSSSTPADWKRVFATAAKNCSRKSLLYIHMTSQVHRDMINDVAMTMDVFRPLIVFSNLTNVKLHPAGGIDLDDTDIKELAQSWPRLKNLELGLYFPSHPRPRMTLSGLVSIAEYCPRIRTIYMLIDACTVSDITNTRPGGGVRNHNLLSLGIGGSPIDSEASVAVFLSDIFPCVDSIDPMIGDMDEDDEDVQRWNKVWDQVNNLLPMLAAVRKQEGPSSDSELSDEEP